MLMNNKIPGLRNEVPGFLRGKRMYVFAAMYYDAKYKDESENDQTYGWIVSDNFIDYNFTATSAIAE